MLMIYVYFFGGTLMYNIEFHLRHFILVHYRLVTLTISAYMFVYISIITCRTITHTHICMYMNDRMIIVNELHYYHNNYRLYFL
jgi:hypothetical protein